MKRFFVILLLGAALGIGYVMMQPAAPPAAVVIDLPRGMSTRAIAGKLATAGVIGRPEYLLIARAVRPAAVIQAGEYKFDKWARPHEVLDRLIRGDVHYYEVTIPEGSNIFDVARLVGSIGLVPQDRFLQATRKDEGYLFPATYRFTRGMSVAQMRAAMRSRFDQAWTEVKGAGKKSDVVTLASLIETEAVHESERPLIASVFKNRLARGISLDCDPTVVYAALLEGKYRGKIYRSDLDRQHPYNTYRTSGLPPGPVANPGMSSLKAALNPAESEYLFFVANPDGSGRHIFSRTNSEHERAVAEYRRGQRNSSVN